MKQVIRTAMIILTAVATFTACKKEAVGSNPGALRDFAQDGPKGNILVARNLVKKGTDSLVYNAGGTLTKVIYSPTKYVTYEKAGNKLTAKTFENNQLLTKEVYTLENGRATESVYTTYSYSIGISKTWWYDYDAQGHLTEKYNRDNTAERMKYAWSNNILHSVKFYTPNDVHYATLQFQRQGQADKLKLNSARSGLDPYLKIFGVPCTVLPTGEGMTYLINPNNNFYEGISYTYDRDGYPVKMNIMDPANSWVILSTQNFTYNY